MERIRLEHNTQEVVRRAAEVLAAGGLVVYPTETMYGVGVDAQNPEAVTKLLKFKNRPAGKAISCLMSDQKMAEQYVELTDMAKTAYRAFLPGPVTIVSKDLGVVDQRLVSELGTLGVRISSHPFVASMIVEFNKPITSTSANPSGAARPYKVDALLEQFSERQRELIDLIIDAGDLPRREPSTVIDTTGQVQEVVRAGELVSEVSKTFISTCEEDTLKLASQLMKQYSHVVSEKPLVFALEGEMGMGKTHFAKGVARALSVTQIVNSPTYSLVKEYSGSIAESPVAFVHMDCWRASEAQPEEIGLQEYLVPKSVLVIEWPAPVLTYLKQRGDEIVVVRLQFSGEGNDRAIKMVAL